jgi:hypothetical protein
LSAVVTFALVCCMFETMLVRVESSGTLSITYLGTDAQGNSHTHGTIPTSHSTSIPGGLTVKAPGNMARSGFVFDGWRCTSGFLRQPGSTVTATSPGANTAYVLRPVWRVWHADDNRACYWNTNTVRVYSIRLGEVSNNFNFYTHMDNALATWNNALPISVVATTTTSNANVFAYGGTRERITEHNGPFSAAWQGFAVVTPGTTVGAFPGNPGATVSRISAARMYVVQPTPIIWRPNDTNRVRMVATHELGHSLGWIGHSLNVSANKDDVMWASAHTNSTLSSNERHHLRQIYAHYLS